MANRLSELVISFQKRNARARGPTSSEAWNNQADELVRDLTSIYNEWNGFLVPLLQNLPDGTNDLNAFTVGLDGRTLLINIDASPTGAYYNTTKARSNSVYEQFQAVYSYVDTQIVAVQNQVNDAALAAIDVPIADSSGLYTSTTVEAALAEIMTLVLATNGTDHGNLTGLGDDDHTQYLPRTGTRAMTGNLQLGNQDITGVQDITGIGTGDITAFDNIIANDALAVVENSTTWKFSGNVTTGSVVAHKSGNTGIGMPLAGLRNPVVGVTSGTRTIEAKESGTTFHISGAGANVVTFVLPEITADTVGMTFRFFGMQEATTGCRLVVQTTGTFQYMSRAGIVCQDFRSTGLPYGNFCTVTAVGQNAANSVWLWKITDEVSGLSSWTAT